MGAPEFSDVEIRNILLEHRYLLPAEAICAKWGITRSRLRTWKREHRFEYLCGSLRELVIVALRSASVSDPAELVSFLDMQDHTLHAAKEIEDVLDALVVEGKVRHGDGAWHYDEGRLTRERPFVF